MVYPLVKSPLIKREFIGASRSHLALSLGRVTYKRLLKKCNLRTHRRSLFSLLARTDCSFLFSLLCRRAVKSLVPLHHDETNLKNLNKWHPSVLISSIVTSTAVRTSRSIPFLLSKNSVGVVYLHEKRHEFRLSLYAYLFKRVLIAKVLRFPFPFPFSLVINRRTVNEIGENCEENI